MAAKLNDRAIDALVELGPCDGIVPLLKQTADFNLARRRRGSLSAIPRSAASSSAPSGANEPQLPFRGELDWRLATRQDSRLAAGGSESMHWVIRLTARDSQLATAIHAAARGSQSRLAINDQRFSDDPPTDLLRQGHYARKQLFSRNAVVAWSHRRRFARARNFVTPYAGGTLLDYGCGDGTFIALVHELFAEATGTDIDDAQVAGCTERLGSLPHVRFVPLDWFANATGSRSLRRDRVHGSISSTARRTCSLDHSRSRPAVPAGRRRYHQCPD